MRQSAPSLTRSMVPSLTLSGKDGTIDLVKDGADWRMTAPKPSQADNSAVQYLLSTIDSAEAGDVVTDQPTGLADYGLEHPPMSVRVKADGHQEEVAFGGKTPDDVSYYAKYADKAKVFTVP